MNEISDAVESVIVNYNSYISMHDKREESASVRIAKINKEIKEQVNIFNGRSYTIERPEPSTKCPTSRPDAKINN
jgi:hypothetical protein